MYPSWVYSLEFAKNTMPSILCFMKIEWRLEGEKLAVVKPLPQGKRKYVNNSAAIISF